MDQKRCYQTDIVRLSGRNGATSTTLENVSELSNLINYASLGAAAALQISSSDATDTSAGVGARTLEIIGLDSSYNIQTETITMNGQTQVSSSKSFLRVFAAEVKTVGTSYTNVGDIYVIKTGTGGTVAGGVPGTLTSAWVKIPIGTGFGTSGMFTVPLGKKYQLRSFIASARGQPSEVYLISHNPTNTTDSALHYDVSHIVGTTILQLTVPPFQSETSIYPIAYEEKTDIYLRSLSSSANGIVSAAVILEQFYGTGR